jgi:GTP-binding protein
VVAAIHAPSSHGDRPRVRHDRGVSAGRPLPLEFVTSAPTADDLPDNEAELAVVGRSNVGKSSLLNALANRKRLALVSKTPGRTQLLNCFALEDGTAVIDCPGYGYASAPAATRQRWQQMMEDYLLTREQLVMILVLVDGEIGPTKLDLQMLEWLRANALPHVIIATKHDKVKAAKRQKRKKDLAAACQLEPGDIIWVSAANGTGIDRLRGLVWEWLQP